MIPVTCGSCLHTFEVPDIKAGVKVLCPPCGHQVDVPRSDEDAEKEAQRAQERARLQKQLEEQENEQRRGQQFAQPSVAPPAAEEEQPARELVGARVASNDLQSLYVTATPRRSSGTRPATPEPSWTPDSGPATHATEKWERPGVGKADESRPIPSHVEEDTRRTNLFRIGLALTIAFLAPIAGMPGHALFFPQFTHKATLLMLLPLAAGITLMTMVRRVDVPLRGVVSLSLGLLMFVILLFNKDASSPVGNSMGAMPVSASVSGALFLLGVFGLFVSLRLRWYRPLHEYAYLIGAVAAGFYLLYLFIPSHGYMPIAIPFHVFKLSGLLGLGMLANVGLLAAAAVICLTNTPSTSGWQASTKAGRAFLCLVGAIAIPFLVLILSTMSMADSMASPTGAPGMGSPAMLFISTALKFTVMYGGLVLLIPVGIVDILVGRTQA